MRDIGKQYKVVKDITDYWEIGASVGDILTVGTLDRYETLFKGRKAVCDLDSEAARECCQRIDENI